MAELISQPCVNQEKSVAQRQTDQALEDYREASLHQIENKPLQRNNTGLPDNLKSGMENLSGMRLDDVRVHYNSAKPAAVQAHAYAQGNEIHLASGQEKHLPHELGHVVQQAEGRVKPTVSVGGVAVNDNSGLENEATQMGERALQLKQNSSFSKASFAENNSGAFQFQDNRQPTAVVNTNKNPVAQLVVIDDTTVSADVLKVYQSLNVMLKLFIQNAASMGEFFSLNSAQQILYLKTLQSSLPMLEMLIKNVSSTKAIKGPDDLEKDTEPVSVDPVMAFVYLNPDFMKQSLKLFLNKPANFNFYTSQGIESIKIDSLSALRKPSPMLMLESTEMPFMPIDMSSSLDGESVLYLDELEEKMPEKSEGAVVVDKILTQLGLNGDDVSESIFAGYVDKEKYDDNWEHVEEQYEHYCAEIKKTLLGLEQGEFGVRWLTLSYPQKVEVASRMALAMMALGEIMINLDDGYEPESDKVGEAYIAEGDMSMAHGSFLWGEGGHTPGDLDLIVKQEEDTWKPEKEYDPEPYFGSSRPPRGLSGDISIGTKFLGTMDHIVDIPLFGDRPSMTDAHTKTAWIEVNGEGLRKLISTATQELKNKSKITQSKGGRKVVNIAVILNFFYQRLAGEPNRKMKDIIQKANNKLISGTPSFGMGDIEDISQLYGILDSKIEGLEDESFSDDEALSTEMLQVLAQFNKPKFSDNTFFKELGAQGLMSELNDLDEEKNVIYIKKIFPLFAKNYYG